MKKTVKNALTEAYLRGRKDALYDFSQVIDKAMLAKLRDKLSFWKCLNYIVFGPRFTIDETTLGLSHALNEIIDKNIVDLREQLK